MHRLLILTFLLLLANGTYSESHTVSFINNCGFGTPVLLVEQVVVSNGSDYSSDMSITNGVAYLDQEGCTSGDSESCMEIEINLSNSFPSFVDIVLIPPQVYRNAVCVTYSDGCDGASLACTEPDCSEAIVGENGPSGSGAVLVCEDSDANVVITFCDCAASPIGPGSDPGDVTTSWTADLASTTSQNTTSSSSTSTPWPSLPKATVSLAASLTTMSQVTTTTLSPAIATATASSTSFTTSVRTRTTTSTGSSSSTAHAMSGSPSSFLQQTSSTATTVTSTSGIPTSTAIGLSTQDAVSRSHNVAAIVGGVLGAILALVLIVVAIFYVRHRRRANVTRMQGDPHGLDLSPGGHSRRSHSVYGDKGPGQATGYAPISRAASPIVHSPQPRPASYGSVFDIRSSSPDNARVTESDSSRVSTISSENPFLLPPLANISSFSLLAPPGRGSPVGSQVDRRASTFDPFADAHSVDDPPPSYMA